MADNTASLNLWQRMARRIAPVAFHEARDLNGPGGNISFIDWAASFRPGLGLTYNGSPTASVSTMGGSTNGYYYDGNAVVFACEANRLLLFSEARFQFQQLVNGRPGDLFGTPALAVLEEPWVGASTGGWMSWPASGSRGFARKSSEKPATSFASSRIPGWDL